MTPVTQDKLYIEEDGKVVQHGNCQQAAVASILNLPLDQVPNFHECEEGFWQGFHRFMASKGFYVAQMNTLPKAPVLCLVYGMSPRNVRHACVYRGEQLVHDPHPSRAGLTKVLEVHLLVPFDPAKACP